MKLLRSYLRYCRLGLWTDPAKSGAAWSLADNGRIERLSASYRSPSTDSYCGIEDNIGGVVPIDWAEDGVSLEAMTSGLLKGRTGRKDIVVICWKTGSCPL